MNDFSVIGSDPNNLGTVPIYTFDINLDAESGFQAEVVGEHPEPSGHPHLEGYRSDSVEYFAVREDTKAGTFYWGPYATWNAAKSVVEERGAGRVINLSLI